MTVAPPNVAPPRLRLNWLHVLEHDDVRPTELVFSDGHNVLLGKNGAGKSTLLNLIGAILSDDLESMLERTRSLRIRYQLERIGGDAEGTLTVDADLRGALPPTMATEPDSEPKMLQSIPRSVVLMRHGTGELIQYDSNEGFTVGDWKLPASMTANLDLTYRPQALASVAYANRREVVPAWRGWPATTWRRFDEALDTLDRMTGGGFSAFQTPDRVIVMGALRHLRHLKDRVMGDGTAGGEDGWRTSVSAGVTSSSALARAVELFDFSDGGMAFSLGETHVDKTFARADYHGPRFYFWKRDGSILQHHQLSFGQKRMLAFLMYAAETVGAPAVLDEIVNGLHHEWLDEVFETLADRQVFFASQNPLLLDRLSFESIDDVRRTFFACTRDLSNDSDVLRWAGFDEVRANRFWNAYQAGVASVHDVLRNEGLW